MNSDSACDQSRLDTLLHEAISAHDIEVCRHALKAGANPDAESPKYADNVDCPLYVWESAPLLRAIVSGFTEGALLLIASGATVTELGANSTAPLYAAAHLKHAEICRALLAAGAPTTGGIDNGLPALIEAAGNGCVEACRVLLEHGADANICTSFGYTPMRLAAQSKYDTAVEVLRLLLAAGASTAAPGPDVPHATTLSAFQLAVATDTPRNVVLFLDECGEDPEQRTADGRTMFDLTDHAEIRGLLLAAVTDKHVRMAAGAAHSDRHDQQGSTVRSPARLEYPAVGAL
jgi:hypothetical protein